MYIFLVFASLLFQSATNNTKGGVGIQGYDPVSYFSDEPLKGDQQFKVEHEDVIYWFSTPENKQVFIENPERYVPVYGGWCAYAMGVDGSKVKIDPKTFKIINDQLYLFYNFRDTNTLPLWNENEVDLKQKADDFWKSITKK